MSQIDRTIKQGDRLLKMPGKFDRGPVEFQSHAVVQEGEVMAIATRNVVAIPQSMSILGAVETMTRWGFRRLPIVDPGTRRLKGIITSGDVIDFLGGGDKFNLVQVKHGGNLLAAVNESVREIMTTTTTTLPTTASIKDAIEIIVAKKVGGIPLLAEGNVLSGIVTERDVLRAITHERATTKVEEIMSTSLRVTGPDSLIGEVTRAMTTHRFRRLPVVRDDLLFGIVTTTDIMAYLGNGEVFSRLVTGDVAEMMALPVREILCGTLHTTPPSRTIAGAAREMLGKNIGALPVIEDDRLIGLVTEFDLIKVFQGGNAR